MLGESSLSLVQVTANVEVILGQPTQQLVEGVVADRVRRFEQRLVEATSIAGVWRLAPYRNRRTPLQPLDAKGAALRHDGGVLTVGKLPSTPELRARLQRVDGEGHAGDQPFACSSATRENAALASLMPVAGPRDAL